MSAPTTNPKGRHPRRMARSHRIAMIVGAGIGLVGMLGVSAAFGLFSVGAPNQTDNFVAGQITPATNFAAGSVGSTSAAMNWTTPAEPAGATITNWTISQSPSGGSGCSGNQPSNPCTLTGLTPNTNYTWTLTYYVGGWQTQTTTSATTQTSGGFSGISSGVSVTNSSNNVVINYPPGTSGGDLVLLVVANNAQQSADFSAGGNSIGWSAVSAAAGYPPNQNGSVGQQELQLFWHLAGAETAVNVRIQTNSSGATAWVLDYKGVPSPALNGTAVFGTVSSASTLTPGTFTTTAANATVISVAFITTNSPPVAPSLSTPNGFTGRVATTSSPSTRSIALGVADESVPSAGSVTSPVWTGPAASQWAFVTAAFT